MKKWVVLCAGVVLQAILGGVYAWSVFAPGLAAEHGLSNAQSGLVFGVTIGVFTVAMVPAGRLMRHVGPRPLAVSGALCFAVGYVAASFSGGRFPFLLVSLGGLIGVGIGAGYVCPLSVAMKWFPHHKGLVTGVAVAGFGGGAVLLSLLAQHLQADRGWPVLHVFRLVGILFGGVAVVAGLLLCEPPQAADGTRRAAADSCAIKPLVLSVPFGLLCAGMFAGTFAGLVVVGNLAPIMVSNGLAESVAVLSISVFALGNASGRIFWGHVHDRFGGHMAIPLSLLTLAIALSAVALRLPALAMLAAVALCGIGFGACFVVYASSTVELFGVDLFPRLYPICFLGYGVAGIVGPGVGGWIADVSGSFAVPVALSALIVLLAFLIVAVGFVRIDGARSGEG